MQKTNLRSVDLNLLVILQQLIVTRNVTRAAGALHMSQPAVSRALQRLRITFKDDLLIKTTQGYDLTIRAQLLAPQLEKLLSDVSHLVSSAEFDPKTATDTVKFYGMDPEIVSFLPPLFNIIRNEAPAMSMSIRSEPRDHFELLEAGEVHFTLSALSPKRETYHIKRVSLASPTIVFLMKDTHPLAHQKITLENYLQTSHGRVSVTGQGESMIDAYLESLQKRRQVVLQLSSFTLIPYFCEQSDILFAIPLNMATQLIKGRPLIIKTIPKELYMDMSDFYLYWHSRYEDDPMCTWVRNHIIQSQNQLLNNGL